MTFDELDDILDSDWNEAVDTFEGSEDDEEFQEKLRQLVRNLQRRAFDRGYNEGSEDVSRNLISARLPVNNSQELVLALLKGEPLRIEILPFN